MRILGIDPGLNITGYGFVDASSHSLDIVDAGVIRPAGRTLEDRVSSLFTDLNDLIKEIHPTVLAVEQIYSHHAHPRTAIQMAHARGVILLSGRLGHLPIYHYSATQIKRQLTGHGRAGKAQVQRAVMMLFKLDRAPKPADVADALAIGYCCSQHLSTNGRRDQRMRA